LALQAGKSFMVADEKSHYVALVAREAGCLLQQHLVASRETSESHMAGFGGLR
jgi:hypothetical protein